MHGQPYDESVSIPARRRKSRARECFRTVPHSFFRRTFFRIHCISITRNQLSSSLNIPFSACGLLQPAIKACEIAAIPVSPRSSGTDAEGSEEKSSEKSSLLTAFSGGSSFFMFFTPAPPKLLCLCSLPAPRRNSPAKRNCMRHRFSQLPLCHPSAVGLSKAFLLSFSISKYLA